jgi:histone chaperone ASF1
MEQPPISPPNIQVNIRDISLDKNPARFDDDYNFTIKFEAMAPLAEGESPACSSNRPHELNADLDWRLIYVGSADTEEFDQELDSCQGEVSTLPPRASDPR